MRIEITEDENTEVDLKRQKCLNRIRASQNNGKKKAS